MATTPVGTTLHYGDVGTDPATAVGLVTTISPGGDTVSIYEVASLSDSYATKIAGRKTPGQMTFECYFDPGDSAGSNFDEFIGTGTSDTLIGTTKAWKITFADSGAATWVGNGIIADLQIQPVQDDVVRFSITIERSGYWTFTP